MPVFTEEKEENFKRLDAKPFRQIFKYALKHWYLLIVAILSLAFTSFFDASFTPLMNNALVTALETQAGINGPLDEFIIHHNNSVHSATKRKLISIKILDNIEEIKEISLNVIKIMSSELKIRNKYKKIISYYYVTIFY